MYGNGSHRAITQYEQVGVAAQVSGASPHQMIQMMLDGAVARVAAARGAIEAGETARKGELIGKAIGLVEGLRVSLDTAGGGEIAENLLALYDYMGRRLLAANLHNDIGILDEVASLLRELQTGWRELGQVIAGGAVPGTGISAAAAR
ncbi:MAG: flagellar export chaperone FliS [Gammaproteobacteria bacterium]|nr:flagellar export chaperone FliS [Gammaproteobacteria bacterium]